MNATENTGDLSLRPAAAVMRLDRLGASFPTRLSFMRILLRRMGAEDWRIERGRFSLDDRGYGRAVYTATSPTHTYSLIAFSQYLDPADRTDRVIAEAWDATFVLFDGVPDEAEVDRLATQAPDQEAGRYRPTDLVLSRANKSVRLFEHVAERLASGEQPDRKLLTAIGYLMRTTAVYANGKFGLADRTAYADRPALEAPFQAEMLAVYLIRWFTFDLVEHVARCRGGQAFVPLSPNFKRYLGIGNATGLGMAPFLVSHPSLIHNWFRAREAALARVRAVRHASADEIAQFRAILERAVTHVADWCVEDEVQSRRIAVLRNELRQLEGWSEDISVSAERPWDLLYLKAAATFSLEGQELLASLVLEPYAGLVDELGAELSNDAEPCVDPTMSVGELGEIIGTHYDWVQAYDFSSAEANRYVWYYSDEKLEPRRGERRTDIGERQAMAVAVARDIQDLSRKLDGESIDTSVAAFLLGNPDCREIIARVQNARRHPYGELRDNLIGAACRPIDILRAKLAYFGASKFDPKSDLWTRITMYQGAPLPHELRDGGDWCFPVLEA